MQPATLPGVPEPGPAALRPGGVGARRRSLPWSRLPGAKRVAWDLTAPVGFDHAGRDNAPTGGPTLPAGFQRAGTVT